MKANIKSKVKAVTKKAKAAAKAVAKKAKAKCKGGKCCAALALLAVLCGCATPDNTQPAKSATMSNTFEDCIIVVAQKTCVSNRVVTAESTADAPAITLFQVAQNLENAGTDSTTQTTTQTPTVDVKPDVDVTVPLKSGTATTADAAATLVGAAAKAAVNAATKSDDCPGGDCDYKPSASAECTGEDCEYSE